jgi:ABC-type transport system involved in multi-copper enzyme maturation permease subunit
MTAARIGLGRLGKLSRPEIMTGITAIGSKELRGRMRGRRAFAFLTFYLVVLSGFVWMLEALQAQAYQGTIFGSAAYASATIGTTIFSGLLLLETLLVLFLAPAFTAGAISQEREKQTLDLLAVTPISSLAIVVGKLFSALAWVFILVVASIPLTALVFVFGGVAPEDLVRGYVVLLIEAIGLGCVGLFCSALLRRTLAATVATYFIVLAITLGAGFVWIFLYATSDATVRSNIDGSFSSNRTAPSEALLWLNPFVADADVLCPTGTGYNGLCGVVSTITGRPDLNSAINGGAVAVPVPAGGGPVKIVQPDGSVIVRDAPPVALAPDLVAGGPDLTLSPPRDTYWPRSAAAWLVLSTILVLLSVNLVSPTRRWRVRRPRLPRRPRVEVA